MAVFEMFDPVALVAVFIVIALMLRWIKRQKTFPPGPYGLPLLGSLRLMKQDRPTEIFKRLREKYGDVFSLRIGSRLVVVINGYDAMKDAFVKQADDFSDRPKTYVITELSDEKGILASSGEFWKQNRTFVLTALREFGFMKRSLEENISDEVEIFVNYVTGMDGRPFNLNEVVHVSVSNVICGIVFGDRFEHDSKDFQKLCSLLNEAAKINQPTGLINCFPILRYLPGDLFKMRRFRTLFNEFLDFFAKQVEMHRESFHENVTRDFIDEFLHAQKTCSFENPIFSDKNLLITLLHLFAAGTETVSNSILWSVLYLLHNTDVQDKMFEEINSVVGQSRPITCADRSTMHYCEAVLNEVLRCSNVVPLSIHHGSRKDILFRNFVIPEGSMIIPNLNSVLTDPEIFPEPEKFDPTRFLDGNGYFVQHQKMVAFSVGRRICLGESLARLELFLFITSLVQRFDLRPEHNDMLPPLDGQFGLTYSPTPFCFRAVQRN